MKQSELEKKKFWSCVIGPVDETTLPWGADLPMRQSVQHAFLQLTGNEAMVCSSGWESVTKEEAKNGLQQSKAYAIKAVCSKTPKWVELTTEAFLKTLTTYAKMYAVDAVRSVKRNGHMNEMSEETVVSKEVVDAVLVDFINYVGICNGVDYALYTKDLK